MGKKSYPQQPAAPDPRAVAQAQTGTNIETAIANAYMGNANEVGPMGTVSYTPTSWNSINGPGGVSGTGGPMRPGGMSSGMGGAFGPGGAGSGYQVPQFTRTTTLSPEQQKLYDQQTQLGGSLNQLAIDQTGRLGSVLGSPINASGLPSVENDYSADRTRIEGDMFARLNPQLEQQKNQLETTLVNQGFQRGTEAFNSAMDEQNRATNDQRLAITAQGGNEQSRMFGMAQSNRQRSLQEMLALRNQPINEISALMSGGQVSLPQGQQYNAPNMQAAPIGDYMYNTAALNQQNYAQQMQQRNAMMGGLFGLGQAGVLGAAKFGLGGRLFG